MWSTHSGIVPMDDKNPEIATQDQYYPLPSLGHRFLLLPSMRGAARMHPLSRDLFPVLAGAYRHATATPRGTTLPDHILVYCSAGLGTLVANDIATDLVEGDIAVLPRGTKILLGAQPEHWWSCYFLLFEGTQEDEYLNHLNLHAPDYVCNIGSQPRLISEIEALATLQTTILQLGVMAEAACRLKWLLAWLGSIIAAKNGSNAADDFVSRTLRLMNSRVDGHLDLPELAQLHGISVHQFTRQFQKLVGQPPINYFIHLKMQLACKLLDTSNLEVKRVAESLGYSDPYYFSRAFKRSVGMSPQQYRKTNPDLFDHPIS